MLVLLFIAWFLALALARGASLNVFWDWFIVNTGFWPDAPDLTMASALGLSFIVAFLTYQYHESDNDNDAQTTIVKGITTSISFYVAVWLTALVYHYLFNIGA